MCAAVQMSCDPAQLAGTGNEISLSESVPVLVSLPVAAPQIQKELLPPTEGTTCHSACETVAEHVLLHLQKVALMSCSEARGPTCCQPAFRAACSRAC